MKPLRILLVDDDASIGSFLAKALDEMGHVVCGIETGAVRTALWGRPDLMTADERLRDGSDVATVETILRATAIPHILISEERLPDGRGLVVKLQKPFMYHDLVNAIERTIKVASVGLA